MKNMNSETFKEGFERLIKGIKSKNPITSVTATILIITVLFSMVLPYTKLKWLIWFTLGVMGFYFMGVL